MTANRMLSESDLLPSHVVAATKPSLFPLLFLAHPLLRVMAKSDHAFHAPMMLMYVASEVDFCPAF
jgi:hypothetical protein